MCDICNGGTWDDVLLRKHLAIESHGWSYTAVMSDPGRACWTYTVGLTSSFDHPELVITGVTPEIAAGLIEELCLRVADGDSLLAGGRRTIGETTVQLLDVHTAQLLPTLADWARYYGSLGAPLPTLRALQVVVPEGWFCGSHADPQPLLDRAWPLFTDATMNRVGRRAQQRAGSRRSGGRLRPRGW
ncbi:MAG TPA: DUF4262 domain-containing protein [Acidimicrobiales bacterium]|nr:DUF4262 domain-containing protein [Acidimicrobiales bacterium]